ncbi:DUF4345 domain-containing protein [Draconibacterium sp. IB214405]|uniref:DUF4345 domain-containing protein n=1 Tax=Draconibacterium sp. IB214405 TaxID=3097352 RepID=UPI002A0D042D|nr:DUF4345 domain-containing protein [Draconibacterium sp. IB214405]MDX8338863.1 DUF4345 domain-containing protein [Draconibacterium sp. IB214405]
MKAEQLSKIILVVCALTLTAIALSFGGNPSQWVPKIYETTPVTDLNSIVIFRSVMGLILGCCAFWIYAALSGRFLLAALYSLMFAMFGLALARLFSLFVDGNPTMILIVYLILEAATGLIVWAIIKAYEKSQNQT